MIISIGIINPSCNSVILSAALNHLFSLGDKNLHEKFTGFFMTIHIKVNNAMHSIDEVHADTPLLWYLRDELKLTGTKFGCGGGHCGACTVHVDGEQMRSCSVKVKNVSGRNITTIEGLSETPDKLHPVQQAWLEVDVPQCGYCQAGQIMAASSLLAKNAAPSEDDIKHNMTNICRCGTYPRIKKAINLAAEYLAKEV